MARLQSDELNELRSAVADLLDKRSSESHVRALMDTASAHDPDLWRELAEMGLIGLLIPEEYGGSGGGHAAMGVVMEEMGAALMCGPFFASAVLTTNTLLRAGDTAEMGSVLPRLASGELIGTVAFAEENSGVGALPATNGTHARQATDGARRLDGLQDIRVGRGHRRRRLCAGREYIGSKHFRC